MFKNYITTAFNSLIKNKLYSVINIVGLAIGLAARSNPIKALRYE